MDQFLMCTDSQPTLFGFLDPSIAPTLMYYAYIPIVLISLFFGIYIFSKDTRALTSRLLLALTTVFSLAIVNEVLQWIAVPAGLVMFGWQMSGLFQVLLAILSYWFVFAFLTKKDLSTKEKGVLSLLLLPLAILLPTSFNISYFDLVNCEGVNGPIWLYVYLMQVAIYLSTITVCITSYRRANKEKKKSVLSLSFGIAAFASITLAANLLGDVLGVYDVNLFGPLGMVAFISFITFMIVRYQSFNLRLLGAQALLFSLWILLFGMLFIRTIENIHIILALSLIVFLFLSIILSRSIRRLDDQKREIEKLVQDLEKSNEELEHANLMKSRFLSIASHQFRSPLTAIKGYASLILDGSYGDMPRKAEEPVERILTASNNLALVVDDFLNLSRIEQGRMEYKFEEVDLREFLQGVVDEQEAVVRKNPKLSLTFYVQGDGPFNASIDRGKLKQVATNLVDNSIKYTPEGTISVYLERDDKDGVFRFWTKDTGVGIPTDVLPKLFGQFTRAANADQVNVMGTGLGLYIAREIVKAHNGKVWAESEGEGKGAKFTVEIPIKRG